MGLYRKYMDIYGNIKTGYMGNIWETYGIYLVRILDYIWDISWKKSGYNIYIYTYGKYLRNIWDICDISSYKGNT